MALQETFIENLKFYRKQAGFSQKDLSVMLNKGYNYINCIEGGSSFPPPQVIDEISQLLGIEPEVLFSKKSSPQNILQNFNETYKKSLETELIAKVSSEIKKVCRKMV